MKKLSSNVRGIIIICILAGIAIALFLLSPFTSPGWWVGLVCACFTFFLIWGRIATKEFNQLPELTTEVTVVAKDAVQIREDVSASGRCDGSDSSFTYRTCYKITFENEIHNQWSFEVSCELFHALLQGDHGTLIYKETEQGQIFFIRFLRQGKE